MVDILLDDTGLADSLITKKYDFEFGFAGHSADRVVHDV